MAERIGEEFDGFIASVASFGFFVEITDLFVEGLVHVSSLPKDRYHFVERRQILRGERSGAVFRIGAPFRVRLDRVDQPQRRVDFSPVDLPGSERSHRRRKW
jgi:ribonuclease R